MTDTTRNGKTYKWAHPSEWLNDHVDNSRGNNAELFSIINALMTKCSEDDIQDLFQAEMDRDGYFTPEPTADDCPNCNWTNGPVVPHGTADPVCPQCGEDWPQPEDT